MAIVSSGAIAFSALQTEFGGSNPISLSEYYRGGSYTTSNNTGVPTSGAISMSQFYSTTAADYVPAALNWTNINSAGGTGGYNLDVTNDQTVTGINATITILVELTGMYCNGSADNAFNGDWSFWAEANGVSSDIVGYSGFGGTSTSFTFTVANNQVVRFYSQLLVSDQLGGNASGQGGATTVTIKNASSGNTVLDTFSVYLGASNP